MQRQRLTGSGRWWAGAILIALFLVVLPIIAGSTLRRLDRDQGLDATYFNQPDWTRPAFTAVDTEVATPALTPRFAAFGSLPFSVTWHGQIAIERTGTYRFVTVSDDGSDLEIDGARVVDNGGRHGPVAASGEVRLDEGLHRIRLDYFQGGGGKSLWLFWSVDGGRLTPIPHTALLRDGATRPHYREANLLRPVVFIAPGLWIAALQFWLLWLFRKRLWRALGSPELQQRRALLTVLAGSAVLSVVAVGWGLRGEWAPDEVSVGAVVDGARQWFAHGWFERYPPLQYEILTMAYSPFVALAGTGVIDGEGPPILAAVTRLVTVEMAVGSVLWVYAIGRQMRGVYAGLAAAVATATLPLLVFYGKTANVDVPYLFWSLGAIFFYVRIVVPPARGMSPPRRRDHWWFACLAVLAVATKDQAYGLFILPSLHLFIARWQTLRNEAPGRSMAGALRRLVADPEIIGAAVAGVAVFAIAENMIFNWPGFVSHVQFITGPGSESYREFPRTVMGQVAMLRSALRELRFSLDWPLTVVVLAAIVMTGWIPRARARLWLLLPAVSYYATFIGVISYSYDRFLLPICVLLLLIAGGSFEDALEWSRSRRQRTVFAGAAAAVALYGLAYGASVDRMMLGDSRYTAENWIADRIPVDAHIGAVGYRQYLPVLNPLLTRDLVYDDFQADPPDFVVVNPEHVVRWPPESDVRRIYDVLNDGSKYRKVFSYKTEFVLAPLANQPEVLNRIEDGFTNLDKINPEIQVFQRVTKPK